jgi:hypothetical protein
LGSSSVSELTPGKKDQFRRKARESLAAHD